MCHNSTSQYSVQIVSCRPLGKVREMVSEDPVRSSSLRPALTSFSTAYVLLELQVCVYKKLPFLTLFKVSL